MSAADFPVYIHTPVQVMFAFQVTNCNETYVYIIIYSGPRIIRSSVNFQHYSQDGIALFCLVVDIVRLSLEQVDG